MEVQLYGKVSPTAGLKVGQSYTLFDFGVFPDGLRGYPLAGMHRYDSFTRISASGHVARLHIDVPSSNAILTMTPTSDIAQNTEIAASFTTIRPTTI
jgi:hypothetical protein